MTHVWNYKQNVFRILSVQFTGGMNPEKVSEKVSQFTECPYLREVSPLETRLALTPPGQ